MFYMSLRTRILQGGAYLALRQGLGVGINLGGTVLLTRLIGPGEYGLYTAAAGILAFMLSLSQIGLNIYLVRQQGDLEVREYHQVFSLFLISGISLTAISFAFLPLIQHWTQIKNLDGVAMAMFASLTVTLMGYVPLAQLERNLDFKRLAWVELFGIGVFYTVSVILAWRQLGAWSVVAGWWAQQFFNTSFYFALSAYRPSWYWNTEKVRSMIGYGLGYAGSLWIYQARDLINPLIVGRFLGAEAVAYVALAVRLVMGLSFVKNATWRLSLAALGKLQNDPRKMLRAIEEGTQLQVLALGPLLVAFVWAGEWLVSRLIGPQWIEVMVVFPFIALGTLFNGVFTLSTSAMYVLKRNLEMVWVHIIHVLLLAYAAYMWVPTHGLVGYGWAEVLAIGAYSLLYVLVFRHIGPANFLVPLAWSLAFGLALFYQSLGWASMIGLAIIAIWPASLQALGKFLSLLKGG